MNEDQSSVAESTVTGSAGMRGSGFATLFMRVIIPLVLVGACVIGYVALFMSHEDRLVVYCAHDEIHAAQVLALFEQETGIHLDIRYDSEATKSLGLVESIKARAGSDRPACDVFWNNEWLGMADLKAAGVLSEYKGPGWQRIPVGFKDPEGMFAGFGARLRVYIVNTDQMAPLEAPIRLRTSTDLSTFAFAKPMYGTTLTQMTIMWHLLGESGFKAWFGRLMDRRSQVVDGNGQVKNRVASGACAFGWTDTDDYFLAEDAGKPVAKVPIQVKDQTGRLRVICIPNTVGIMRESRHRKAAERLADFLLSERVQIMLANGRARQIPLGPVDASQLPRQVQQLMPYVDQGFALPGLLDARNACLKWLIGEFSE